MINYKKSVICLTLILVLMLTSGVFAQQFDDVPRDHWAYDSVQTLANRGYLSLYSGEDFNGKKALTRYEMAEIIANLLDNTTDGNNSQNLSEEDVDIIRELSLEFRDELVTVAERQKKFDDRLNNIEDTNQIQDEDIANINVRISEMGENVDDLSSLDASVKKIEDQVASLELELAGIKKEGVSGTKLQELEDNQSINMTRIQELERRINALEGEKTIESEQSSSSSSVNTGYILGGLAILALLL